jgi:hypothetical protein
MQRNGLTAALSHELLSTDVNIGRNSNEGASPTGLYDRLEDAPFTTGKGARSATSAALGA